MSSLSSINSSHGGHAAAGIVGATGDPELACKYLSQESVFLQIIDASFDGTKPEILRKFSSSEDIYKQIKILPPHASGKARILDVTVHSDFLITGLRDTRGPGKTREAREGLMQFLRETYTQRFDPRRTFRWLNDPLLVNDIGSISSQWSQSLGSGKTHFYRLVNRTSLQQDPLDFDLHPRDSYLTCAQDEDNRLLVVTVNDVWSRQSFRMSMAGNGDSFDNPRSFSSIEAGTSWTSFSTGSLERFAQLLVLDFFVASIYLQPVDYYEKLIYAQVSQEKEKKREVLNLSLTKNPHLQVPLGLFEPRLSARSKEAFKEIEDAEGILRSIDNLVDSIEYIISMLDSNKRSNSKPADEGDHKRRRDCTIRIRVLKGLCSERRNNAKRALDALNRQLDYLTKRHAIREAKSIRILTILASFYLPLSLSASLLGMQSPFKDIAHDRRLDEDSARLVGTNLLFDFFGLFVVLSTGTLFIVYAIRLVFWLHMKGSGLLPKQFSGPFSIVDYGKRWQFSGLPGKFLKHFGAATKLLIGGVFGVVLLVIFLMGMLKNAQSAWDTAKWFFTAYSGLSGLLVVVYVGLYSILYRQKLGGGWIEIVRHNVLTSAS
ncbi:hypothetical protein F4808DRAFT_43416 [Astrocystis sublimbata]|nr:hypothetical protein F4808DRAFT_43416 [Astrocystis sublimbata]